MIACSCSDAWCRFHGCRLAKQYQEGRIELAPQGCICPPTSEQTCQNPVCPRKNPRKRLGVD